MQLAAIVLFMIVLPIVSIVVDTANGTALVVALGKWFVFWGVGWRLATAAVRQLMQPAFTAEHIFEIRDPAATALVLEIGFGNLALGIPSIASLWFPDWVPVLALAGAIFYGLAGLQHVRNRPTTRAEIAAMASDLGIAAVLIVYLIWLAAG